MKPVLGTEKPLYTKPNTTNTAIPTPRHVNASRIALAGLATAAERGQEHQPQARPTNVRNEATPVSTETDQSDGAERTHVQSVAGGATISYKCTVATFAHHMYVVVRLQRIGINGSNGLEQFFEQFSVRNFMDFRANDEPRHTYYYCWQ